MIDEEQRFGVAQKERIRQLTRQVDVLTLTATPIPRTLNMSLAGARDMSVIETPPRDRLPVHTEIVEYDEDVIADALLREVDRGGQVFFVHNRVESIHNAALAVAEARAAGARRASRTARWRERELERVMLEFLDQTLDVLVSTMIIESGLDIPTREHADRGSRRHARAWRSSTSCAAASAARTHRAFAYLLVPSRRVLTEDAEKRLRVIEEFDELGVGLQDRAQATWRSAARATCSGRSSTASSSGWASIST